VRLLLRLPERVEYTLIPGFQMALSCSPADCDQMASLSVSFASTSPLHRGNSLHKASAVTGAVDWTRRQRPKVTHAFTGGREEVCRSRRGATTGTRMWMKKGRRRGEQRGACSRSATKHTFRQRVARRSSRVPAWHFWRQQG